MLQASTKQDTQRLSQLMLDTAPALIAYIGCDERYQQANAAYQRWFGIAPQELIGKSVLELFGASLYGSLKPRLEKVLQGEQMVFEEHYPNGTEDGLILEVTYTPDFDQAGAVRGFTVLGNNVTERRRAEEKLRQSEERWRGLFEHMAEGFFVGEILYDENGQAYDFRFVEVNPSFAKLTGFEQAVGKTARDLIVPLPDDLVGQYAGVVETGTPAHFEVFVGGQQNRWYEARAQKADELRFSVLFTNVTEQKRTQEELRTNDARMIALARLGDQLRDPRDVPSITLAAMAVVGEVLGVARAGYGIVDESGEYIDIGEGWIGKPVSALDGRYRFQDFGEELGKRLRQGETIVINDTTTDPITAREADRWKALGIRSAVNLPLVEQGELTAVLFLHDTMPREWTEPELLFIRKAADRTWTAVDRAHVLQELEESEEFARSVLASSPDCVKILALNGGLLSMNAGGCKQLEIEDVDGCLGQPWRNFWFAEDRPKIDGAVAEARRGTTVRFEGYCPTAKGTPKWWEVVVTPVKNTEGQPVRLLAMMRDITERRDIERERERLNLELKRSNEELSSFAHVVAHDLQSPLRGLTSFAQLLERDAATSLTPRHREFLNHIVDNAGRMRVLVEELLRFAQVGQGEIETAAVSLDAVVDMALRDLRVQIEETGATVTRDTLPTALGDTVQLVQLFQNLISNGLKYGRANTPTVIHIQASPKGDELFVSVEDNGEGIAAEYLQQVFEPMKRLHGSEVPGSGLGLSVCRKIVERHGGRIWADSTPGQGSTFFVTLPRG